MTAGAKSLFCLLRRSLVANDDSSHHLPSRSLSWVIQRSEAVFDVAVFSRAPCVHGLRVDWPGNYSFASRSRASSVSTCYDCRRAPATSKDLACCFGQVCRILAVFQRRRE